MYKDVETYADLEEKGYGKLRSNVVRIIPFTQKDIGRLLSAGSNLSNIQHIREQMRIYNEPAINVFYGKLSPDTNLNGLRFGGEWPEDGAVSRLTEGAKTIVDSLTKQGTRANHARIRMLSWMHQIAGKGYELAKTATGLSINKVGSYTLRTYGSMNFHLPQIRCLYYMPEDVNFAIKSLSDLIRLVYPNTVSRNDSNAGLFADIAKAISDFEGRSIVVSPTPAMIQVGHICDIAPVCVNSVNVKGSGGFYTHSIGEGKSISIPTILEINIALEMYMNLPESNASGYHWLNLKLLNKDGNWGA
jgi:hypothetical protein